jgi:hypothetical protein
MIRLVEVIGHRGPLVNPDISQVVGEAICQSQTRLSDVKHLTSAAYNGIDKTTGFAGEALLNLEHSLRERQGTGLENMGASVTDPAVTGYGANMTPMVSTEATSHQ